MKKKIALTVVAVVIVVVSVAVAGCNKFSTDAPALSDIYVNYSSTQAELDGAALELILPDGWTVLSSASGDNADSDIGYIASMNAFIVTNSNHDLSVVKVPEGDDKTVTEEDFLIPPASAVRAIKAVGNYFAVRVASSSGFVGVMDTEGNWRVNANKTRSTGAAVDKNTLSSAIRIFDDELVAVAPANAADSDITGSRSYTPVYRISTGELVCRVLSGGTVSNIYGFDGKYITVERSSSSSGLWTEVYTVPATRGDNPNIAPTDNGRYTNPNGKDDYYTESLYLGDGKFYIHTEWTVNADESAHGVEDVKARLALGYRAVALKPIAKTLSVSFRMAAAVHEAGAQCLCADLTVNPFLAQWNKQFAARTGALDKMNTGCVEVNGDSNYVSWELQKNLLPAGVRYRDEAEGVFTLDREFYEKSGALFGENGYFSLFS